MKISKVFIGHGDNSFKVLWGGGAPGMSGPYWREPWV